MQIFILKKDGELEEMEAGCKVILDLGMAKTIEIRADDQDYKGEVATLFVDGGKPFAKLVNRDTLMLGLNAPALKQAQEAS